MKPVLDTFSEILVLIVAVAIISVLLSKKSQTVQVIQAAAAAFSNILSVVVSPITDYQSS